MSNPDFSAVVTGTITKIVEEKYVTVPQQARAMTLAATLFNGATAEYFRQDKFTTCAAILDKNGKLLGMGCSRRNPIDEPNELRGRALALSRAARAVYGMKLKSAVELVNSSADSVKNHHALVGTLAMRPFEQLTPEFTQQPTVVITSDSKKSLEVPLTTPQVSVASVKT